MTLMLRNISIKHLRLYYKERALEGGGRACGRREILIKNNKFFKGLFSKNSLDLCIIMVYSVKSRIIKFPTLCAY